MVKASIGECGECGECGGPNCTYTRDDLEYETAWACPDCGAEGSAFDADVYGSMSVPWGFLL